MKRIRFTPPPKVAEEKAVEREPVKLPEINADEVVAKLESRARAAAEEAARRMIPPPPVVEPSLRATFNHDRHERIKSFDVANSSGAVVAKGTVERDEMGYMVAVNIKRVMQ